MNEVEVEKNRKNGKTIYLYSHWLHKEEHERMVFVVSGQFGEVDYVVKSKTIYIGEEEKRKEYVKAFEEIVKKYRDKGYDVKYIAVGYSGIVAMFAVEAVNMGIPVVVFETRGVKLEEVRIL